jgi:uncharacterized membrane protein
MKRDWTYLLGGIGLGTTLMYLLDPQQGRRRRAQLRDRAVRTRHVLQESAEVTARDVRNRARGTAAEVRGRMKREGRVADDLLAGRVRAALGRVVSHPGSIEVDAMAGRVTLSGPVLGAEVDHLLGTVSRVRGVIGVENRLDVHEQPGNVPGLQGGRAHLERIEASRSHWSPAARFAAGAAGSALAAFGLFRGGALGAGAGLVGAGLVTRAVTNLDASRLTGIGAGRGAVEFQKTLNIHASPEKIFEYCSNPDHLAELLPFVRQIRNLGDGRYQFVLQTPAGALEWEEVVTEEVPNQLLSFKNGPGTPILYEGTLRLDPQPDGTTRFDLRVGYTPPGGAIGHALASMLGGNPRRRLDYEMMRFKSFLEEGKTTVQGAEVTDFTRGAGVEDLAA